MSNTVETYQNLITSEHKDKEKFMAMIAVGVAPFVRIQDLLNSFSTIFDLSTPPVGDQLDIIGKWVGVSRNIAIPISGVYFSWDAAADLGWEYGVWASEDQPTAVSSLPDDSYLVLIKAKIAANHWDGTTEGAYTIWNILFPNLNLLIQDNQNMSFVVAVQGTVVDSLTLALITGGYILLRPEGVQITEYIVPVDTNPLFGWDIENAFIQGWNEGSWGMELPPT